MKNWILGGVAAFGLAGVAQAEAPKVAADIAPVHSLAAIVMQGVGEPALIVPQGVSPHGYQMRPSEAQALQSADVVFFVGESLSPALAEAVETLAKDATHVELPEVEGMTVMNFREAAVFEDDHGHGHDHDEHEHEEHGHDDHDHDEHKHEEHGHDDHGHDEHKHEEHGHDDHDHDEHKHEEHGHDDHDHDEHKHEEHGHDDHDHDEHGHDEHGHDEHDHHDHDHDGLDPHIWLDPENGRAMLAAMAEVLAKADPENAATYRANAEAGQADLAKLIAEIGVALEPVKGHNFIVFHDAYQYFEKRFGLTGAGSLLQSDASAPSAARLADIREMMEHRDVVCVFSEPQFNPKIIQTVAGDAKVAELDPIGVSLDAGPTLYGGVIRGLADAFTGCLGH